MSTTRIDDHGERGSELLHAAQRRLELKFSAGDQVAIEVWRKAHKAALVRVRWNHGPTGSVLNANLVRADRIHLERYDDRGRYQVNGGAVERLSLGVRGCGRRRWKERERPNPRFA
jgi:hypothetical protein